MPNFQEFQYLIIGGAPKGGTTSLFMYLADHPQIFASSLKETSFFMDEDYPRPPKSYHYLDGLDKYTKFFADSSEMTTVRLEASPDYLYSSGTPKRIKETLPNVKLIFVLREPISRLISWYRFCQQRANIPDKMTFDEFVEIQLQTKQFDQRKQEKQILPEWTRFASPDYFFRGLEHGRYSLFLKPYLDTFGHNQMQIIFYKDFISDPQSVLEKICKFTEIDPVFYANYDFKVFNQTKVMKNTRLYRIYCLLKSLIRRNTHNLPIHKTLRHMKHWFEPLYFRLNTGSSQKVTISSQTETKLRDYYREDIKNLEKLLGYPVPWL